MICAQFSTARLRTLWFIPRTNKGRSIPAKKLLKFFQKPIDKWVLMLYNNSVRRQQVPVKAFAFLPR
jgi:hypothetical protein